MNVLVAVFDAPTNATCARNFDSGAHCGRPKGHEGPCSQVSRWVPIDQVPHERARHVTSVEADAASIRRGGSTRTAVCLCGWRGPQRATLELVVDDALEHERENAPR